MGNFRSDRRDGGFRDRDSRGFGGGDRGGGRSFGGDRGGRGGGFGRDRPRPEMHEATCDKCGKTCELPFRPTGNKPVFCSDCFKKEGGSNRSNMNSGSRNDFSQTGGGMSSEQFNQINAKLDKIISVLDQIEFESIDEEEEEEEEEGTVA